MDIKTFPLQFTEEKLDYIRVAATGTTIKKFINDAIDEKILKDMNELKDCSLDKSFFEIVKMLISINKEENVNSKKELLNIFSVMMIDMPKRFLHKKEGLNFDRLCNDAYFVGYSIFLESLLAEISEKNNIDQYGSYVYLLKSSHGVKIGKSKSPRNRVKNISTQMPFKITSVECFKVDHMTNCETFLHQRFKEKRLNGEWFLLDDSDINYCREYLTAKKVLETKGMKELK